MNTRRNPCEHASQEFTPNGRNTQKQVTALERKTSYTKGQKKASQRLLLVSWVLKAVTIFKYREVCMSRQREQCAQTRKHETTWQIWRSWRGWGAWCPGGECQGGGNLLQLSSHQEAWVLSGNWYETSSQFGEGGVVKRRVLEEESLKETRNQGGGWEGHYKLQVKGEEDRTGLTDSSQAPEVGLSGRPVGVRSPVRVRASRWGPLTPNLVLLQGTKTDNTARRQECAQTTNPTWSPAIYVSSATDGEVHAHHLCLR